MILIYHATIKNTFNERYFETLNILLGNFFGTFQKIKWKVFYWTEKHLIFLGKQCLTKNERHVILFSLGGKLKCNLSMGKTSSLADIGTYLTQWLYYKTRGPPRTIRFVGKCCKILEHDFFVKHCFPKNIRCFSVQSKPFHFIFWKVHRKNS